MAYIRRSCWINMWPQYVTCIDPEAGPTEIYCASCEPVRVCSLPEETETARHSTVLFDISMN